MLAVQGYPRGVCGGGGINAPNGKETPGKFEAKPMHFDPILGEARGIEPTPTPSEGSQNFPDLWAGKDESNPTEDFWATEHDPANLWTSQNNDSAEHFQDAETTPLPHAGQQSGVRGAHGLLHHGSRGLLPFRGRIPQLVEHVSSVSGGALVPAGFFDVDGNKMVPAQNLPPPVVSWTARQGMGVPP